MLVLQVAFLEFLSDGDTLLTLQHLLKRLEIE